MRGAPNLAALALLALTLPAFAQGTAAPPEVKSFGDWTVRCIPGALPPCEMFQVTRNKQNKRVTSIAIAYLPRQSGYALQVSTPLGISFAKGLRITASGFASQAMPYLRCDGAGCYVQGAIENGALDALSRSQPDAKLSMVAVNGRGVDFPLSLRGFAEARAAMESLARAKIVPPNPPAAGRR